MIRRFWGIAILWALGWVGLFLAGCDRQSPIPQQLPGTYPVEPALREFYAMLGGQEILGPAITPGFRFEQGLCQYTQNVLMCFNPNNRSHERFYLFPLADFFNVREDPGIITGEGRIVSGYLIYEEFVPLYDRLYGALYAGRPLTQPRYNASHNRIEQYFENVGFYRNLDEPPGSVHLLAYGVFACDAHCRYQAPTLGIVTPHTGDVAQPFLPQLTRLGGPSAFGNPLSEPYIAPDGALEQIYETVIIYAPSDQPRGMRLRPLSRMLGMLQNPPGPQIYSEADGMVFYPTQNNLGYHVPLVFDQFIAQHGGRELSGQPLEEITPVEDLRFRQCFENYCLIYDHTAAPSLRVRLLPLGQTYLRIIQAEGTTPLELYSPQTIRLFITPAQTRLPADQPQTFTLRVLSARDDKPLQGVESYLWLTLPDSTRLEYRLPPTNAEGLATLSIAPLTPQPLNGSVISYQVCLNLPSAQSICQADSYLIWNYR